MNNLASVYDGLSRAGEAIALLEDGLPRMSEVLGEQHPHTLSTMNNLGLMYKKAGQLERAMDLLERTLAGRRAATAGRAPEYRDEHQQPGARHDGRWA